MCVDYALMNAGDDCVCVHDIVANFRNDHMCVYYKFSLEPDS